jgi:hypothetical protein
MTMRAPYSGEPYLDFNDDDDLNNSGDVVAVNTGP